MYAIHKSADGFGLVAHGLKGCVEFEGHRRMGEIRGLSERTFYIVPRNAKAEGSIWKQNQAPAWNEADGTCIIFENPDEAHIMKILLKTLGILIFLGGGVWFLQGINILPGSFMTGQLQWAIIGAIAAVVGIGLVQWGRRLK
jgi:hypothetical protein